MVKAFIRKSLAPLTLVVCSVWQFGSGLWIHAKAEVAQQLIASAWQHTLQAPATPHKPWQWADTWPVLQLQTANEESTYVLAGTSGAALAFGPGLMEGTALPGAGTTVLAAHRDTHFAFLENTEVGDELRLQNADGEWFTYAVSSKQVVDSRTEPLVIAPDAGSLVLVTCYPFDAITAGGPLRLVVEALPLLQQPSSRTMAAVTMKF